MAIPKDSLLTVSKCYAYTWHGEKIFEGDLTQQSFWCMQKTEFHHRNNREAANKKFYARAAGAWALCSDLYMGGHSFEQSKELIMQAWMDYIATYVPYEFVPVRQRMSPFVIAVLGWHSPDGNVHVDPIALRSFQSIQDHDFKRLAEGQLRCLQIENKSLLPIGYPCK
jgi:hypothetical protein